MNDEDGDSAVATTGSIIHCDEDHHTTFQQTQAQLEAIENDIRQSQPLTSELMDVSSLRSHYCSDDTGTNKSDGGHDATKYFVLGIDELAAKYSKIRKTRGDGNCYYRSFLYALCETVLESSVEKSRIIQYGMYDGDSDSVVCRKWNNIGTYDS